MGWLLLALALGWTAGCEDEPKGTAPPPGGWANSAPTVVDRVVNRDGDQLLEVRQGQLATWVKVPDVGAKPGDYILLGQGTPRNDVAIPELGERAAQVVDIDHARVVDLETAKRSVVSSAPANAVPIGTVYDELDQRAGQEVVVYGAVAKATGAIGWNWVHLQDGTGDRSRGTHDLTVQTRVEVAEGVRIGFKGVLRQDVDLGFGYHYDALVEEAQVVE